MGSSRKVLAFDAGGGSVRTLQIEYTGERLYLKQQSRIVNGTVSAGGNLYWNILGIYKELIENLQRVSGTEREVASCGIDTMGNSFSFLDKSGNLIENPYCSRDKRTARYRSYVEGIISPKELYFRNGIQQHRMNVMYQLASLVGERPYLFDYAGRLLFLPDILAYYLTGELQTEYTTASISQLYSHELNGWDFKLINMLGIPERLFSSIVEPGTVLGSITPELCSHYGIKPMKLINVGTHDTASAIAAIPEPKGKPMYISSGTWSIIGTETDEPVINEKAHAMNCSNEGGVDGRIRLLKNVMGLWIFNEVQRRFAIEGRHYTYDEMNALADSSVPFRSFIDPDDEMFYEPADMPEMIRRYCRSTSQPVPETDGELVRTVLESLAFKYRYVMGELSALTGTEHDRINIVGGGAKNSLLCEFTANCCRKPVIAGPTEAAALGNGVEQLIALGEISDLSEARNIIKMSFPPVVYMPRETGRWDDGYGRFLEITGLAPVNA
ncbi:MAG TPA: rhamnulokinase family protein [Clostridia bacterium]|nr:rhamnulokinase family protein [Clostridia bacterium]